MQKMNMFVAFFVLGVSGLRLNPSSEARTDEKDTKWIVVLSTTDKNNIVEPIMERKASTSAAFRFLEVQKSKSCAGMRKPNDAEILMSCTDNEICLAGKGYQSREESTVAMIKEAVNLSQQKGGQIRNFELRTINIGDSSTCTYDYAYALPWNTAETCKTQLFPDFTFEKWPEAGLLPDFTSLTNSLHDISKQPAEKQLCGFAGALDTNSKRREFVKRAPQDMFEVINPSSPVGIGGGRIAMDTQAQQWACMVDLPAAGYSGRVPMLLHTGRPVLMVERDNAGHFTDRTWYANMLQPDVHYIPVNHDLSNLEEAAKKALSKEGLDIAFNAQRLAADKLTKAAAIEHIASLLTSI